MDSAVEKAREIKQMIADGAKLHAILEEFNCWGPLICDALLSSHSQLERMREALALAEDVLSRSPFSTQMWPNGMHPQTGIERLRAALTKEEKQP